MECLGKGLQGKVSPSFGDVIKHGKVILVKHSKAILDGSGGFLFTNCGRFQEI